MVQYKASSLLLLVVLIASTQSSSVDAKPAHTVRDLVEHELFSRDLETHRIVSREEIEELFGREVDAQLSDLFERKQAALNEPRDPHPDGFTNFFQSVGDFVKRCARGYWKHMIRKAHMLVGQTDGKDELSFLPREEGFEAEDIAQRSDTSWFGKALNAYRDTVLKNNPGIPAGTNQLSSREHVDFSSYLARALFDELHEERNLDHSEYESRDFSWLDFEERDLDDLYLDARYFDGLDLEEREHVDLD